MYRKYADFFFLCQNKSLIPIFDLCKKKTLDFFASPKIKTIFFHKKMSRLIGQVLPLFGNKNACYPFTFFKYP